MYIGVFSTSLSAPQSNGEVCPGAAATSDENKLSPSSPFTFPPRTGFSLETRNLQDQKYSNFPAFFLWENWKESIQPQ